MSESVWIKEVSAGLLEEIKTSITYTSAMGFSYLDDKQVTIRKPEEDLKFEKYPCVSIYITGADEDLIRYDPNLVAVGRDNETHTIIMEEPHQPFILSCQIDFWAKYQEDIDEMIQSWLEKHYRQFNLPVEDSSEAVRTCNCMCGRNIVKSDLLNGKERLFHSIINLDIWVELDSKTRYNKPMVDTVNIDLTTE